MSFAGDPGFPDSAAGLQSHVVGGADLDGDGRREVFVQVGHGASTAFVSAFRLLDDAAVQLRIGRRPLDLGVDGSVGHVDGFSCHPPTLTAWSAGLSRDGKAYVRDTRHYELRGASLVERSFHRQRVHAPPSASEFIDCAGLPTDTD